MATRNFWVSGRIDGNSTTVGTGPRSKDGGMEITIKQREEGIPKTAFEILCRARGPVLVTTIRDSEGNQVAEFTTER